MTKIRRMYDDNEWPVVVRKIIVAVLVAIVVTIMLCNLLSGCKPTEEPVPIMDIKGAWYAVEINTQLGQGMLHTIIEFDQDEYVFYTDAISGKVTQRGAYELSADSVLTIQLCFTGDLADMISTEETEWKVVQSQKYMVWYQMNSANNVWWSQLWKN